MNRQDEVLKAYIGIRRTTDLIHQVDVKDVRQHGLNVNEFAVLELLLHKGPTPIREIKKKILVAGSSTTYILDKLTEKGLVHRVPCEDDRRVSFAQLTDRGRAFIEEIFPGHAQVLVDLFASLSDEELMEFRRLLKKISRHIQNIQSQES